MSSKKTNQSDEYEPITNTQLLDETFDCLHRTARSMCQTLGRPKDRVLCRQTLHDLTMFNRSECTQIKHYVHTYLRFYLKALRWTQVNQPMLVYKKWVSDEGKWRKSNSRYTRFTVWWCMPQHILGSTCTEWSPCLAGGWSIVFGHETLWWRLDHDLFGGRQWSHGWLGGRWLEKIGRPNGEIVILIVNYCLYIYISICNN